jgi:hypothetical protein
MKRNTMWSTLAVLFLVAGFLTLMGCSAADQAFTGTLEQTDKGLVLKTSDGANTSRVVDNPDLRALAGKSVKLTGSLMDREAGKAINVKSFEVMEGEGTSSSN